MKKTEIYRDMTSGPPLKLVLFFSIPLLIGGIFQLLYGMVDTLVVGNTVGSRALAAVGATSTSVFFLNSIAIGVTGSFSVAISQYFGAKNERMMQSTLVNALYVTIGTGLLMTIAGIFGSRPLLQLLGTPAEILDDAADYLRICIGYGSFAMLFYNAPASILRGIGDSRTPLYFLIIACLLNIALDLYFVLALGLAVRGVAIATVLAQLISALLCILYMLWKYPIFRIPRDGWKSERESLSLILRIGIPQGLQFFLLGIGDMAVTSVINGFGTNAVAAFTAGHRVQQAATLSYHNIASGFSVYAGQNLGARKFDRIHDGVRKVTLLVLALSVFSSILLFFFGETIVRWFISDRDVHLEEIVAIARTFLRVYSFTLPFLGLIWLLNNVMRGLGDIPITVFSGMVELAGKVGFSFLFGALGQLTGVWFANPIGWFLGIFPLYIRYRSGKWMALADRIAMGKPEEDSTA